MWKSELQPKLNFLSVTNTVSLSCLWFFPQIFAGIWDAVERLLTLPFREPLPVPGRALFLLVSRILSVDHSTIQSSFKTTPNHLLIFGHLSALHEAAWGMLRVLTQVARLQMYTLSGSMNFLLKQQLRKQWSRRDSAKQGMDARVRSKMYQTIHHHIELEGVVLISLSTLQIIGRISLEHSISGSSLN